MEMRIAPTERPHCSDAIIGTVTKGKFKPHMALTTLPDLSTTFLLSSTISAAEKLNSTANLAFRRTLYQSCVPT